MSLMLMRRTAATSAVALFVTCSVVAAPLRAQDAATQPGAQLTVYHAIYGPGDSVWEKFGHNAIWIHDGATGTTSSYNYGMFDFQQPGFVPRLMRGDMLYQIGVRDANEEVAIYSYYDRAITVQELNLTPLQRHLLREFLDWNWLPENRDYLYDYFRDNCSTRVRDALDQALGGAISHLGDRLFREPGFARGEIVDFIDYFGFFVGNVADIALVGGAIAIVLELRMPVFLMRLRKASQSSVEAVSISTPGRAFSSSAMESTGRTPFDHSEPSKLG